MSGWKSDNYALIRIEANGTIRGHASYVKEAGSRRDTIVCNVQTPLFPIVQRTDFTSMSAAKQWADTFIDVAVEVLEARKLIGILRFQAAQDYAEILQLKEALHNEQYPHTAETEVG